VPYLAELGISHCYASPYLRARPGSMHGYDIIDHSQLNPEIGSPKDLETFVEALHKHEMGHIVDVVPNHMGVMGSDDAWWMDVLENGEASAYADFFDIDWDPLKEELKGKVLVPVLGDQYGTILDRGELQLSFDQARGEFSIFYHQHRFPVNPKEYPRILGYQSDRLAQALGAQDENYLELQNLISSFNHLPARQEPEAEKREERTRDKEITKRRLAALCGRSPAIERFIAENVQTINGVPGQPESFEELHELIKAQAYRLAYWRVAADDINYRRFFDVNDLAGLRQENEAVFEETHRFLLQLVKDHKLEGLRIDHPDGLYDPAQYFRRLQAWSQKSVAEGNRLAKPIYVVVEKILTGNEALPKSWPVDGTTGYDFGNLVSGLFVDPETEDRMTQIYEEFIDESVDFDDLVFHCKQLVMERALASELNVLASMLIRIALANRHTCDFTLNGLRDALAEIAACFPVYRTYVRSSGISQSDQRYIEQAVAHAKRRSTSADSSVYDFIQEVLLTRQAAGAKRPYRDAVVKFAMKFQQFTSVVMAKGVEDTAFYRYNRLVSLNEVGGDPRRFGVTPDQFHRSNATRNQDWPHSMLATSTHDTKRSEDVRARIHVLSEIPEIWREHVTRWRELNSPRKSLVNGDEAPSRNDEYLLYQTLVGAWPLDPLAGREASFLQRVRNYMLKASREAKDRTSWAHPDEEYEKALTGFVDAVLAEGNGFVADFLPFQREIARIGMYNSLSQLLLKLTTPGVPDIYQGNELWDFSLVDPDNRRAVDYDLRRGLLERLKKTTGTSGQRLAAEAKRLAENIADGTAKLFLTWRALHTGENYRDVFEQGAYAAVLVTGEKSKHVIAYSRAAAGTVAITVTPRLCAGLFDGRAMSPMDSALWEDTAIFLPAERERTYLNVLTGETVGSGSIRVAEVLRNFPVALLVSQDPVRHRQWEIRWS
jgi:(1->4)-alpha-D-glucan 1-alpha-D-glucosylmutase